MTHWESKPWLQTGKYPVLKHLGLWVLGAALMYILIRLVEPHEMAMKITTVIMLPGPVIVYLHLFALTRYFERRRYWQYALAVLLVIAIAEPVVQFVHRRVDNDPNSHTSGIGTAVLFILVPAGYRYFNRGLKHQYRLQEAEQKQLQTELALLKSQVNPHFFFNTLNNLYALSLDRSTLVPDVILKLSDLMRYVLDGSKKETADLEEEIRFIRNYIDLESMRLSRDADIQLNLPKTMNGQKIAPLILMPFVENAFKHGLNATDENGFFRLDLNLEADQLLFSLTNSKPKRSTVQSENSSQLGLANVKRRLDILYPQRHALDIVDAPTSYTVQLTITL